MLGGVEEDIKVAEGNACLTDPPSRGFCQADRLRLPCRRDRHSHGAFKFKEGNPCTSTCWKRSRPGCRFSARHARVVFRPARRGRPHHAAGGQIQEFDGVDVNEYLPAAKLGVTKINIDTTPFGLTRVHREFFRDKPAEFDFRPPGKIFIDEYAKFIASRNDKLGSSGQIPDLRKSLGK